MFFFLFGLYTRWVFFALFLCFDFSEIIRRGLMVKKVVILFIEVGCRLLRLHFDFIDCGLGYLKLWPDFFIIQDFIKFKYFGNLAIRVNFLLESIFLIILFYCRVKWVREKCNNRLRLLCWLVGVILFRAREDFDLVFELVAFKVVKIDAHHYRVLIFGSRVSGCLFGIIFRVKV